MFNPPNPGAQKEETDFNLSNIRSISKALQARIHVQSENDCVKFIFVIKIEVPASAKLFWDPQKIYTAPEEQNDPPEYIKIDF